MKTLKLIVILFLTALLRLNAGAQSEGFYHEFPVKFNDSVSMYFQQNSYQISDTTFLSTGNYGSISYSLAGMVISDSSGNVLDTKYLLDIEESFGLEGLIRLDDNRFVLFGEFDLYSDNTGNFIDLAPAMVCFNQQGEVIWQKAYGGYAPGFPDITEPSYDYYDYFSYAIIDTAAQRIYAMGLSQSFNPEHVEKPYVVCTDYDGDTIWTWAMPEMSGFGFGKITGATINHDGDLVLVGQLEDFNDIKYLTYTHGLILKLTSNGEMQWYKLWGDYQTWVPISCDILELNNGEYIVGGLYVECDTCTTDVGLLMKTDSEGNITGQTYITKGNNHVIRLFKFFKKDYGFAVLGDFIIPDNGEIAGDNFFVNKYSYNLDIISETNYGNADDTFVLRGISETFDGGYLFTGVGGGIGLDPIINILMKSDGDLNLPMSEGWQNPINIEKVSGINYFPNPAGDVFCITSNTNHPIGSIIITNLYGRTIHSEYCNENSVQINTSQYSTGMYILNINGTAVGKLLVQH